MTTNIPGSITFAIDANTDVEVLHFEFDGYATNLLKEIGQFVEFVGIISKPPPGTYRWQGAYLTDGCRFDGTVGPVGGEGR